MKIIAPFLALIFVAAIATAQDPLAPKPDSPVVETQPAAPEAPSDEWLPFPRKRGNPRANPLPPRRRKRSVTVNTLEKVKDGGWAMIPLGMLSVLTVMLCSFIFTLRRSSILTTQYMNTADVLLKKRDYLGLLAISSRHSESVARVSSVPSILRRKIRMPVSRPC